MGIYINPPTDSLPNTKESWLEDNYISKTTKPSKKAYLEELLLKVDFKTIFPVCLVDNGLFTAAAVADSKEEFEMFHTDDGRFKLWYTVDIKNLVKKSSGLSNSEKIRLVSKGQ